MTFPGPISIPTLSGSILINFKAGSSIVFIGANGTGKTRLGVFLDTQLSNQDVEVHRIAAHRSLTLNTTVVPPSLESAQNRLFYGKDTGTIRLKSNYRFGPKAATMLLSDFDHVMAALYAENHDISIQYRQNALKASGPISAPPLAKIDKLKELWEKLLPHRKLIISGGNLKTETETGDQYSASEMSDGERVIFYLIAQALLVKPNTLLIFDEPELHINRAILDKLWDEIEAARPDCCFLYITHDIEFASSRHAATKYALRSFQKSPRECWDIELIPNESELPEDIIVTIVGSRKPVLFVEGDGGSLDSALYRRVYDQFTVIPVGPCDQVIHTVASFATRPELHRIGCAGLVDADGRTDEEAAYLKSKGIYRLPVSEVENLLLLPKVFLALASDLKFSEPDAQAKLTLLQEIVLNQASQQIDAVCLRYTKRRLDSEIKKIGLTDNEIHSLDENFRQSICEIDPVKIFTDAKIKLNQYINSKNYDKVLLVYDNKGLLSEVAKQLGYTRKNLEEFIGRTLRSDSKSPLHSALQYYLPVVTPKP